MKHKPAPENQLFLFAPSENDKPTLEPEIVMVDTGGNFQKDDRIIVVSGRFKGKTGVYFKSCSKAFPEYCRVFFDLRGRQKVAQYQMILKSELNLITT